MYECENSACTSNSDDTDISDGEEKTVISVKSENTETATENCSYNDINVTSTSEPERTKSSKMKDAFVSFLLFVVVSILTHGFGGPPPFVLPTASKANEGTPAAAAPPNLRIQLAPPPKPFFGPDSAIDDFYGGDVYGAFAEADLHENALLIYYAPWDADSRAARNVLELISDIFADSDLYIGAINCWTSRGECFKQFGANQANSKGEKAPNLNPRLSHNQFPILVFYPKDRKGVQYHGPLTVEAILEFILSARNPVFHVRSKTDLSEVQARHNGKVIVAYFPDLTSRTNLQTRKSFKAFLNAAFHFLESDPFRVSTGGFAAVTSQKVAFKLHLGASQPLRYFFWNGTSVAYPNKTISSADSLIKWVVAKSNADDPLASWIGVVGRKSISLSQKLTSGTGNSLLVFIPRINRFTFNEALSVVQETSILYKSCQERRQLVEETQQLLRAIRTLRRESSLKIESLLQTCRTDPWFLKTFEHRPFCSRSASESFCSSAVRSNLTLPDLNRRNKFTFRRRHIPGRPFNDNKITEILRMHSRLDCTLAHFASEIVKPISSSDCESTDDHPDVSTRLTGLSCIDNRTLNFFTIDYNAQIGLAQSLGLDHEAVNVLIVNPARETYYLMEEDFTIENLSKFIEKFHRQPDSLEAAKLSRGYLSTKFSSNFASHRFSKENSSTTSRLNELSRESFLKVDRTKPLLLLYVAPSCGFCAAASRAFHSVQKFFTLQKTSEPIIQFSTINTSSNDLPWSFTAFTTPSVIFVPAGSDSSQRFHSESRVFPSIKPLNVTNLLNFIIANLPNDMRINVSESLTEPPVREKSSIANEPSKMFSPTDQKPQIQTADVFQSYREEL